jgi:hypothetical protein
MEEGLVAVTSRYSAPETTQRLLAALAKRDLTVFARIDHAANAAAVGMPLRPTEVVLFGNPKGGTASIYRSKRWSGRTPRARFGSVTTRRTGSPRALVSVPPAPALWRQWPKP